MSTYLTDLRHAVRQLIKYPGFSLVAILTLGIGIGAIVVIFSVYNGVVLRHLPYSNPEQLVRLREVSPQGHIFSISEPNFHDFRERSRSFSQLVAVSSRPMTLAGGDEPLSIRAVHTTNGLFDLIGIRPSMGRPFSLQEFEQGDESAVVAVSYGFWVNVLGSDPDAIGTTLDLDGVFRTVTAILPEGFDFPFSSDIWLPLALDASSPRDEHRLESFGRLREGISLEVARTELNDLSRALGEEHPESNRGWGTSLITLRESEIGPRATKISVVLLGAGSLLLLLACASVSNLLLVRAAERSREIALRATLGAVAPRIVRQLLIEGLVLAGFSTLVGLLFSAWVLPVIQNLESAALPRLNEVSIDISVLSFAVLIAVLTGVVCGVAPAVQASSQNTEETLRTGERMIPRRERGVRDFLVAGQLALAVVLLVGAGLLLNSFVRMLKLDPGFEPENILAVEISLPEGRYQEMSPEINAFFSEAVDRVSSIPGINAAGLSMVSLISGNRPSNWIALEENAGNQDLFTPVQWRAVSPGFFEAMNSTLIEGRFFDSREATHEISPFFSQDSVGEFNVLIGESLAAMLGHDDDLLGKRLVWSNPGGYSLTVVGIVKDIGDLTFPNQAFPTVFLPTSMVPWPTMTMMINVVGNPTDYAPQVRTELWAVDPSISIQSTRSMEEILSSIALSGPRLNALLVGFFASVAVALAALGIYGVTAFTVARRTREIGVRMALGADPGTLVSMALNRGVKLILVGSVIGLIGALLLSRFLESLLFGITPNDPITYLLVVSALGMVVLIANYLPARAATKVDPRVAFLAE